MFKAFLKKVEETTKEVSASLNFKETSKPLDNIIKEIPPIPDSIKNISNIDLSLKSPGPPAVYYKENIDLHPGSTFLKKYQEKLGELHSNNVILSKKAEAVDRKLPTLLRHCTNHHDVWRRLQGEIARLPELSANYDQDFVLVKIDELEVVLTQQVEMYHATELAKQKEKLVNDGLKYQAHRQKELASLEEELATAKARFERDKFNKEKEQARHQRLEQEQQRRKKEEEETRERRRKYEQDLKDKKQKEGEEKAQQEKLRVAAGTAFQQQMDQFKKFGAASIAPVEKKDESGPPVEAIVPEENQAALEEFFQDLVNSSDKLKKEAERENETEEEEERNPLVKSEENIEEPPQAKVEEVPETKPEPSETKPAEENTEKEATETGATEEKPTISDETESSAEQNA